MKRILFIVTLFIFCIGWYFLIDTIPDNDLWARLIAGSHIVENLEIIKNDFLSYTPTHIWYDHEWGASVIFYLALKYFGISGLMFLKGIVVALTLFFSFKTIELRKPQSSISYNILYYIFLLIILSPILGYLVRCLIFTCLFFAIFVYILEYYRIKGGKCLLWLPFLMLLWSNIHGGCISAFGLLAIYIFGEFLNKKPIRPYILTLIACFAVLFINPYGIEYVKFLFFAAAMDRTFISEWKSPFVYHFPKDLYIQYKLYLLFVLTTIFIYLRKNKISYEKLDKTKMLLILAMIYLSATHIRHITFFVYIASTFIYEEFYYLLNEFLNKIRPKNETFNRCVLILKDTIVYSLLLFVGLLPIFNDNREIKLSDSGYPYFMVEFIKLNNLEGNLFVNFDYGSYAAYKLYPNNLIVMDGRYEEVYNPDLLFELKNFHRLQGDWYKVIRDYKTDVMLLEKKYPVFSVINSHPNWTNVFENTLFAVFVPSNKVKENYIYPTPEVDYYNKNVFKSDIESLKSI